MEESNNGNSQFFDLTDVDQDTDEFNIRNSFSEVGYNKYLRVKDANGHCINNFWQEERRVRRPGEDRRGCHIEEVKKFSAERNVVAGEDFSILCNSDIHVEGEGKDVPYAESFEEMKLFAQLTVNIRKKGYIKPSAIQKIAIPLILKDYDVIALASTGSGKTAAFMLPIINNVLKWKKNFRIIENSRSPFCIIVVPTKELAQQLYEVGSEFTDETNCSIAVGYGGIAMESNKGKIKSGCDILVCTVGRLCDLISNTVIWLGNVKVVVFDEADKLLNENDFYGEIQSEFLSKCPLDKQIVLVCATDNTSISKCQHELLRNNATKVIVGSINTINTSVKLSFVVLNPQEKVDCILEILSDIYSSSVDLNSRRKIIIFVNTKRRSDTLACFLSNSGYKAYPMNGDRHIRYRLAAKAAFQSEDCNILVATNVMARGIDLKDVTHVIVYDIPRKAEWESYVHRVGRTGRIGNQGEAITFYCRSENFELAPALYVWTTQNGQDVPDSIKEDALAGMEQLEMLQTARMEYMQMMQEADSVS